MAPFTQVTMSENVFQVEVGGDFAEEHLLANRSPQLVPKPQHSVGYRCLSAPAGVRAVTARAGIVALISCCLVRLSSGGLGPPDETVSLTHPGCTQQSICRGAAVASRLVPLAFSGDKRGRTKGLFLPVLNGASVTDPDTVCFCM